MQREKGTCYLARGCRIRRGATVRRATGRRRKRAPRPLAHFGLCLIIVSGLVYAFGTVTAVSAWGSSSRSTDATATERYLTIRVDWVRIALSELPEDRSAVGALVRADTKRCHGVTDNAPRSGGYATLAAEMLLALIHRSVDETTKVATRNFSRRVAALNWGTPALNRIVSALRLEEDGKIELLPPDPCSEARAWVAGGYGSTPAATVRFLHMVKQLSTSVDQRRGRASSGPLGASVLRSLRSCLNTFRGGLGCWGPNLSGVT
jgi:hypothetical protein